MATNATDLAPDERELRGHWPVQEDRSVTADAVEQGTEWLTKQKLERIAKRSSGWETLYRDPTDGRLWELTYPQSKMHGGGPRRLHVASRDEAAAKYSNAPIYHPAAANPAMTPRFHALGRWRGGLAGWPHPIRLERQICLLNL